MRRYALAGATLLCLASAAVEARAAIRLRGAANIPLRRTDFADVRFFAQDTIRPGFQNNLGQTVITHDSDPLAAMRAAANTWSSVPGSLLRFARIEYASTRPRPNDGQNGIILEDSLAVASVVGDALATTSIRFSPDGVISETDIYLNPRFLHAGAHIPFSTSGSPAAFDLQAVILHELGHAAGANHAGVVGAVLFATPLPGSTFRRRLSHDDESFAREAYPAPGVEVDYGRISGRAAFLQDGRPVRRGLVVAADPSVGVTLAVQSDSDGLYEFPVVPPGNYFIYAEPVNGPVLPAHLGQNPNDLSLDFRPTFFGNNTFPLAVSVNRGLTTNVNVDVQAGDSMIDLEFLGVRTPAGPLRISPQDIELPAGRTVDLYLYGRGIDAAIRQQDLRLLGPGLRMRDDSLVLDQGAIVNNRVPVRVRVEVADRNRPELATVAVSRGIDMGVFTGALVILPASPAADRPAFGPSGVVNAASFTPHAYAPESWISIFGERLAPSTAAAESLPLPTTLAGTQVLVRDFTGAERPSPLSFVSPGQINFLLPAGAAVGPALLRVVTPGGELSLNIQVDRVAPGIFAANRNGQGPPAAVGVRVRAGGAQEHFFTFRERAGTGDFEPAIIEFGPPEEQVFVSLFCTGLRRHQTPVSASVGGLAVPVTSSGPQGQYEGLDQVNIGPLPRALAGRGAVDVFLTVDGKRSNTVVLNVR